MNNNREKFVINFLKYGALSLSLSLIMGCGYFGDPKIDASTDESFKSSITKVGEKLPKKEQEDFFKAVMYLSFKNIDFFSGSSEKADLEMRNALNGKTAKEIINEANILQKEDKLREEKEQKEEKEKEIVEINKKIKLLENRVQEENSIKSELSKITFEDAKYFLHEEEYENYYIMSFKIKNNSNKTLKSIFCKGSLISKDRKVPWHEADFNFDISGGLEIGESKELTLKINRYSSWDNIKAPEDAIFLIETVGVKDEKDARYDFFDLDDDVKKLNELKKELL